MLLVIGVYTYKVLLLTLLVGIPNTITRHLKRHKLADKNDKKNYFMAHKKEIRVICGSFITLRQRSKGQINIYFHKFFLKSLHVSIILPIFAENLKREIYGTANGYSMDSALCKFS